MRTIATLFLAIAASAALAQNKIYEIVFFEAGQSSLTPAAKMQLDHVAESLRNKTYHITLAGHADTTGSKKLNLELSQRRTQIVSTYLVSKGIAGANIKPNYYGELNPIFSNRKTETRIKNRCVVVDVEVEGDVSAHAKAENEVGSETSKAKQKNAVFEYDTVIRASKGTLLEIPAETFYPNRISDISFEIKEVFTVCDLLGSNILMRTVGGDCLTSAGMIFVKPTIAGVEVQPNKGKLIRVKVPTQGGQVDKEMTLYGGVNNPDGTIAWKNMSPEVSYQEQGDQYYVFNVDTLSSYNLDKPIGVTCSKDGPRIKIPAFKNAIVTQTYPNETYLSVGEKKSKRKYAIDKTAKDKKPILSVVGFYKDGNPYFAQVPLSKMKYRRGRDLYIVGPQYFKRILKVVDANPSPYDYLCNFTGYFK